MPVNNEFGLSEEVWECRFGVEVIYGVWAS